MSGIRHSTVGARTLVTGACLVVVACTSTTETRNPVPVAPVPGAIEPVIPATVRVSPSGRKTIVIGGEVQLVASVLSEHQQEIPNAVVSWASSALNVATVSPAGLVHAVGSGTAFITA